MDDLSVSESLAPEVNTNPLEGKTYGEDPSPFPSELPQDVPDPSDLSKPNPMEATLREPAMEMAQKEQEDRSKWMKDRLNKVHNAVLDFDNFYPEKTPEARKRAIISGLIKTRLSTKPDTQEAYETARYALAQTYFDGKGGESDDAMFEAIKEQSETKKSNEELHRDLKRRAFTDAMSGKTFQDYKRENQKLSDPRKDSLQYAYEQYKSEAEDEWGRPLEAVREVYGAIAAEQDPDKALDIIAAVDKKEGFTDEEHAQFLQLFKEVAINNPSPTTDDVLDAMGLDTGMIRSTSGYFVRSWDNIKRMGGSAAAPFEQVGRVAADVAQARPTPRSAREMVMPSALGIEAIFSKGSFRGDKARYSSHKRHRAFLDDAQAILDTYHDPMELHFEEGSTMAAIEEGIYAMPSAVASSVVAAVPVVGLPLAGAMMHGYGRDTYRQRLVDAGWDRSEALERSEIMGAFQAVPNAVLNKFQAGAFFGKIYGFDKMFAAVNKQVNNLTARALIRFGAANTIETGVELAEELVTETVQYYANAMDSRIPDVEWYNGKDGVFDGYFNKFITTWTAVAPLGASMAVGGISTEKRAEAFALTPRQERELLGVRDEDNDRLDEAETIADKVEATRIAFENRDPWSPEVLEKVEKMHAKAQAQTKAVADLQRAGDFPIFRTSKADDGVVDVVNPKTGEVLDRIDNNPQAAVESAISYMELETKATQAQIDELVGMLEVATLDVKEAADAGATVELELGTNLDVRGALERFSQSQERTMSQVERLEKLQNKEIANGGDGGMSRAVFGVSQAQYEGDQKNFLQRIFAGTSAMTIVHERGHASFRQALDSGSITLKEAYDFFFNLDKALEGKTDKQGKSLRFMPEGTKADDFTAIDEAVAEFSEVMLLRTKNGKKTAMREAVGRQMSAMAKRQANGGNKFKAFYDAMVEFFGQLLARSVAIRSAVAKGEISESEVEAFRMKLQGTTEQEAMEESIRKEVGDILHDDPFSIGSARDRKYMDAVESGDVETQQRMVDEAARKAGYGRFFYHGTDKDSKQDILTGGVDQYKSEKGYFGRGFYTATDKQLAIDNYAEFADDEIGGDVIGVAIADTATVLDLSTPEGFETYKNLKYRGVPVEGLVGEDNFHEIMTSLGVDALADNSFGGVVVYNEKVLKTTDPVTYDADGNVIPLSQRFDPSRDEISFSISPAQDAAYMDAVESGDMEAAQSMVDEAAKKAGYDSPKVYHGTNAEFSVFENRDFGRFWFTPSKTLADRYATDALSKAVDVETDFKKKQELIKTGRRVGTFYLKGEFREIDAGGSPFIGNRTLKNDVSNTSDDIVIRNVTDYPSFTDQQNLPPVDQYGVVNPNQIKSADPVTRDADGNVIPLSQRFDTGRDEIAFSVGEARQVIEESADPIFKHILIKEDQKFIDKIESGDIVVDQSIEEFEGQAIFLHQPDGAMAGKLELDGEVVVNGKGGVYYPVLFADQGYFWASTKDAAKGMATQLNAISKRNNGKILMGLTSAPIAKMFSSTTMSTGAIDFFVKLAGNSEKYGITEGVINRALVDGSRHEMVVEKNGKKSVKKFKTQLDISDSLDVNVAKMKKNLAAENSIFGQRGVFVRQLAKAVADSMALPTLSEIKKMSKEEAEAANKRREQAKRVANILASERNLYKKSHIIKGKLSEASIMQGLGDLLAEPLVKTFQQLGDKPQSGRIYAVLEMDGEVEAVEATEHESYPFALKSTSGKTPKVHVLERSNKWSDAVSHADGKDVAKGEMDSVFPPSAGVSTRELVVKKPAEGVEALELSFSIGDAQMKDTIINDAMKRMRDPEGVAVVLANIVERVSNLKREVPKIIKAFGKEVEQKAIVDPRLVGELKSDAARMRREAIEDAENAVYDKYGDILDNDSLVKLADQPVTELILAEGGLMSLSQAKRNKGDEAMTAGEFEEAAGLPPMYYGGSQSPDQMAQQLADEGVIRDSDVSTMMEAIESEMTSVTNRKQDLKDAKAMLKDEKAKARQTSKEWLDERIAEQKRDYNPMARAKRALVTLSALRTALPMEIRGKIGGDVKLLTTGSDEKRLEYLQKTLEKLDKELEKYVKGKANEQIDKVFRSLKNAKLTPDTQQTLADIQKYSEMSQESVDERIEEIGIAMEQTQAGEGLEELEAELINLSAFGARSSMNAAQLQVFLDNIISIKNLGKTIRQVRDAEYKAMIEKKKEMVNSEVTGGKGKMSAYESKYVKDRENKIFAKLKDFHFKNISFEWLLNAAVRADKNVGTLKSRTHNTFATMVHRATHNEKRFKRDEHLEYSEKMTEIFGSKGVALANKIESKMMRSKDTGVTRLEYEDGATEKVKFQMKNLNAVLDGSAKAESYGWSDADLEAAKAARDEELEKRNARRKTPISELPATAKLSFSREKAGKEVKILASQSEAIALIMMYRQDGIRESMINEGYTEEAMEALENDYLTDEGRQVMEWLTEKYEENYHVVNEVYRAQYGVNLPKVEFYAPVRRVVDRQKDADMKIDDYGNSALSTKPSFLFGRVTNYNEIDTDVDALTLYSQHMSQTHHYVAWADTIKQLRSVFNDKKVRKNIIDYAGKNLMKGIDTRIDWMADGGNRMAWHSKMLDKLRLAHTFSSLSYNIGVGLKQLTSLPAYAFDMPLHEYAKYQAMFFSDVKKHWSEMWALDYVQTRFKEGYDRDVAEGIRTKGDSYMSRYVMKGLQTGMLVGKTGDITPVIIGGWAAKRRAYDKAIANGMSKKEAEAYSIEVFEMTTDRAQQAVDQKDMGYYQNAGSLFKVFTMYKTSPRQYYANTSEAILDAIAGKKGATKEAARRMFISQIILPVMFQFASDSWRMLGDEDKEYEPEDYARAILLGSLNGLFLVGEAAASLASVVSDAKVWQLQMTLFDSVNDLIWAINKMKNKDFLQGVDELAEAMGKIYPSPLTFYKIIKQRGKDVPDWD